MLLALLVTLVAAAHPATTRQCGMVGGEGITPSHIVARGETCAKARQLANRVSKVPQAPFHGCAGGTKRLELVKPCHKLGYDCRGVRRLGSGGYGLRVACRRGQRSVTWDLR